MSHSIENYLGSVEEFLDKVFSALSSHHIDVGSYELDHICYMVETDERYSSLKNILSGYGKLLSEAQINGRAIGTYKLEEPIVYKDRKIYCVELPSPKEGLSYKEGYEHVEFVIDCDSKEFMQKHKDVLFNTTSMDKVINPDIKIVFDGFAVKFHFHSLEYVITYLQG